MGEILDILNNPSEKVDMISLFKTRNIYEILRVLYSISDDEQIIDKTKVKV